MGNYAIEELIAHRDPMILISRMVEFDDSSALCEVDIHENSPFYQSDLDGVASYIGIEYMAQAIAAYAGAQAREQGNDIEIGFLLGSRKYQTFAPSFSKGTTYQIRVEELYQEDSGLSVFDCEIVHRDSVIAQAKVNAFQPDDPQEFLKEQQ